MNNEPLTANDLILKGLGKAKVRQIVKKHILNEFNEFLDYGNSQVFQLHLGGYVHESFGLPTMNEDDEFTLEELVDY